MTTTNSWGVVSAFQDSAAMAQAVTELQDAGFTDSDIRCATFSDETPRISGILSAMSIPEEDAAYYQREFEAGRPVMIITSSVPERQQEAIDIMRGKGGYDVETQSSKTAD